MKNLLFCISIILYAYLNTVFAQNKGEFHNNILYRLQYQAENIFQNQRIITKTRRANSNVEMFSPLYTLYSRAVRVPHSNDSTSENGNYLMQGKLIFFLVPDYEIPSMLFFTPVKA